MDVLKNLVYKTKKMNICEKLTHVLSYRIFSKMMSHALLLNSSKNIVTLSHLSNLLIHFTFRWSPTSRRRRTTWRTEEVWCSSATCTWCPRGSNAHLPSSMESGSTTPPPGNSSG